MSEIPAGMIRVYSPGAPARELIAPAVKFQDGVADVDSETYERLRPTMAVLGLTTVEPTQEEKAEPPVDVEPAKTTTKGAGKASSKVAGEAKASGSDG